jgi:citrate synthase
MSDKKFELLDKSSGKKTDLPVREGSIGPSVVDIANIKDHGIFVRPGYGLTAATDRITYIDGEAGPCLSRLPDRAARGARS